MSNLGITHSLASDRMLIAISYKATRYLFESCAVGNMSNLFFTAVVW